MNKRSYRSLVKTAQEDELKDRYYVHSFNVSTGGMDYLWGEWFDTKDEAIQKLISEANKLQSGIEITIGIGSEESEWGPPK